MKTVPTESFITYKSSSSGWLSARGTAIPPPSQIPNKPATNSADGLAKIAILAPLRFANPFVPYSYT